MYRSIGNATPPVIGDPWSPDPAHSPILIAPRHTHLLSGPPLMLRNRSMSVSPQKKGTVDSPDGTNVESSPLNVSAFAGPMSPSKALEFHRKWASPSYSRLSPIERRQLASIRCGDSEKGLERAGRDLAHGDGLKWNEYWEFLGCYTDLSVTAGLDKLEAYLADRIKEGVEYKEKSNIDQVTEGVSDLGLEDQHEIFLLGSQPSRLDQDVLLAIEKAELDNSKHRHIKQWRDYLLSWPQEQRYRWTTPKKKISVTCTSVSESPGSVGLSPLAQDHVHGRRCIQNWNSSKKLEF